MSTTARANVADKTGSERRHVGLERQETAQKSHQRAYLPGKGAHGKNARTPTIGSYSGQKPDWRSSPLHKWRELAGRKRGASICRQWHFASGGRWPSRSIRTVSLSVFAVKAFRYSIRPISARAWRECAEGSVGAYSVAAPSRTRCGRWFRKCAGCAPTGPARPTLAVHAP